MKMKRCVVLLFGLILICLLSAQIILNEFMIDPDDENTGEFIELYNISSSTINLCDYYICDEQDTDKIIPFPDSMLAGYGYALLLDPNYAGEYDVFIPLTTSLGSISDPRFGKYGISNSSSKVYSILDSNMNILDSYCSGEPEWPASGYSIERYLPDMSLWSSSLTAQGSPGYKNSISPKAKNISIEKINSQIIKDSLQVSFYAINCGMDTLREFKYQIEVFDSLLQGTVVCILSRQDSIPISRRTNIKSKGRSNIKVKLTIESNSDSLQSYLDIPIKKNDFIISEFVCRTGENFNSEYIEIISKCHIPVQLQGIKIHDMTGSVPIDSAYVLAPDSLICIAQSILFQNDFPYTKKVIYPPAWRSLNNNEDLISFESSSQTTICSLSYNSDWALVDDCAMLLIDTLLDYRDPANWESSYEGSPGKLNQTEQGLMHASCQITKKLFTPLDTVKIMLINDGYLPIEHAILNVGNNSIDILNLNVNDTFEYYPDTSSFVTEGTESINVSCSPYFDTGFLYYRPYSEPASLLNEILFDPIDTYDQEEFIEIENRHIPMYYVDWTLKINNREIVLNDSSYAPFSVFCDEDSYLAYSSMAHAQGSFPSLPNGGAEIYLIDPMGMIVDFCDFRDHSAIAEGRSLEKQFTGIGSSDPSLWYASVSENGMTPGKQNSITASAGMKNSLGIYPRIFSKWEHEHIQFSIDAECGLEYCELRCYNVAGHLIFKKNENCFSQASVLIFWNAKLPDNSFPARGIYLVTVTLHTIDKQSLRLKDSFIVK